MSYREITLREALEIGGVTAGGAFSGTSTYVDDPKPDLVTVPNIEIAKVGEEWETMNGPQDVTADDLASAVAAPDDPAVKQPRLKIGHLDPRFTPDGMSGDIFDGTPALGKFLNLRLTEGGQTLVGDIAGVPKWLAEIMPTAYANRSMEGYWGVKTKTGKEHRFVVTAVSLLGVRLPAIETLDDLPVLYTTDGPDGIELVEGERIAATRGGEMPKQKTTTFSVSSSDVRTAFYEQVAVDDRYWWWINQVYFEPSLVVADDENGGWWVVPFTVKNDTVTFDDAVEAKIQWVAKDSGKVLAAANKADDSTLVHLDPEQAAAVYTSREESVPADRVNKPKEAKAKMATIDVGALRTRLGLTEEQLPDDATEEQINELLSAEPEEPETDDEDDGEGDEEPTPEPEAEAEPVAAGVDPDALAQLKADAAEGRKARAQQNTERRHAKVKKAIDAGKIPGSRKKHFRTLMDRDEEGTTQYLDSLEAGVIPNDNEEQGEAGEGGEFSDQSSYPDEWLSPAERRRIDAARSGEAPRVAREDREVAV